MSNGSKGLGLKAAKGAGWASGATIAQYGLSLVVLSVLARLIAPAEFGLVALSFSFLSFAAMFAELGMSTALMRREHITEQHVSVAFAIVLVIGMAAAVVLIAASGAIASFFGEPRLAPMLRLVAIAAPLNGASSIPLALLSREGKFKFIAVTDLAGVLVGQCAISVALALAGFGAWAPVIGNVVQQVLSAGLRYFGARHSVSLKWDRAAFNDLFAFSASQTVTRWFAYASANGDNFVVGRLLGMAPLGLYGRAFKLMMVPVEVISSASQKVVFPMMAQVQGDDERLRRAYLTGVALLFWVLAPGAIFTSVAAGPIISIFLGGKWTQAAAPVQMLFLFMPFRAISRHINNATYIRGNPLVLIFQAALQTVMILGGAIAGAKAGSITWVALAVGVSLVVNYLVCAQTANKLLSVSWSRFALVHAPGLLTAAILAALLAPLSRAPWMQLNPVLALASYLLAAAGAAALLFLARPNTFVGPETLRILAQLSRPIRFARPVADWCDRAAAAQA